MHKIIDNKPLVSILVPIYGVEKFISRCAISLFAQTYKNIEYIFVDDCSPDHSIEILNEIIRKYPSRENSIKIIHHSINKGLAAARNTAVGAATGQFIMHVDSDDWLEPQTVEVCVNKQNVGNYDIIATNIIVEWPKKQEYQHVKIPDNKEKMLIELLNGSISHNIWGRLIRRDLYTKYSISQKEGINMGEDYAITPILYFYADKISFVSDHLYHYFQNPSSMIHTYSRNSREEAWKSIEVISSFFSNKNHEYNDAINVYKIGHLMNSLVQSIRANDCLYYKITNQRINNIDASFWNTQSIEYKILFKLKFKFFRSIFLKIMTPLWRLYKFNIKLK